MTGEGPHPATGETATFRTREELVSPDQRHFEMFLLLPGGGEHRMFRYAYTRER